MFGFSNEAIRAAARFELDYRSLCDDLACHGRMPPSRDVVLEHVRRDPNRTAAQVIAHWRAYLKPPILGPRVD
jgi:plasmid stabilization system protein ParE